ncbi:MAG: hypothetical protein ACTSSQ_06500 [Alphaproteobacteria bacterium]
MADTNRRIRHLTPFEGPPEWNWKVKVLRTETILQVLKHVGDRRQQVGTRFAVVAAFQYAHAIAAIMAMPGNTEN